jgi:protein-S-isoprenylcysteine O-methyltransferase Ste14
LSCYSAFVTDRGPHPLRVVATTLVVIGADAALMALALGGIRPLLRQPYAIALLALWCVSSLTLGALRPVRRQDVTDRAPDARGTLLALAAIPLLTPAFAAWTERLHWGWLPGGAWLRWGGVAIAAAGLALRIMAMTQLGQRFSPRVALQHDHALETRGLYSIVRHPGYLGSILANLGAALAFASAPGVLAVGALALVLRGRMAREEALLARHFGGEYERYRARTGGLLPRARRAGSRE